MCGELPGTLEMPQHSIEGFSDLEYTPSMRGDGMMRSARCTRDVRRPNCGNFSFVTAS